MTNSPIPDFARVTLSDDPQYMTVWFHWSLPGQDLDRPCSQGISCLPRHVPRLIRAFLEGALFDGPLHDREAGPQVDVDVHTQTYVLATCKVYSKRINADLRGLGY